MDEPTASATELYAHGRASVGYVDTVTETGGDRRIYLKVTPNTPPDVGVLVMDPEHALDLASKLVLKAANLLD